MKEAREVQDLGVKTVFKLFLQQIIPKHSYPIFCCLTTVLISPGMSY